MAATAWPAGRAGRSVSGALAPQWQGSACGSREGRTAERGGWRGISGSASPTPVRRRRPAEAAAAAARVLVSCPGPRGWHSGCLTPHSFHIFNCFLNKGLSLHKGHCSAHQGRPPRACRAGPHLLLGLRPQLPGWAWALVLVRRAAGQLAPRLPRAGPHSRVPRGAGVQATPSEPSVPRARSLLTPQSPGSRSPDGPGAGGTLGTPPRSCPGR